MAVVPQSVDVRVYNVGLGDCILLTFKSKDGRSTKTNRILIDFGSTGRNKKDGPKLKKVADQIVADCGGKNSELAAVVVTHRHQDHMSGFGGDPGEILTTQLRPKLILQPWTEEDDADEPAANASEADQAAARHVLSLKDAQEFTDSILNEILVRREKGMVRPTDKEALFYGQKNLPFDDGETFKGMTVKKVGETTDLALVEGLNTESITNADAISKLQKWSWKVGNRTKKAEQKYLQKNDVLDLAIPGLTVKVLGPVGPDKWEDLKKHEDTDELWRKLQALRSDSDTSAYVEFDSKEGAYGVPSIFGKDEPVPDGDLRKETVRWLIDNLDQLRGEQLLGFVRALDKHINNTSLVLLFEFGGFRMLFPGDAEVASWQAIVEDEQTASALKDIDLYKVGHHGSDNATPIVSLWEKLIQDRDEENPLHCVLSTQTTKFPGSIPNSTLLETMLESDKFHLVSTAYPEGMPPSKHADDWEIHAKGSGTKRVVMSYARDFDVSEH